MKNRVMAKKLAILGFVPCLISSSLQISVHALSYSIDTSIPVEVVQKEDVLESTITSVTLDHLTVYCDQEGAQVGQFKLSGKQDSRVTLDKDAYDNTLFVIEDNILRTREKLENGVTYTIQVVYEGEIFKFKIRAISEVEVLPIDPEEGNEVEVLPIDPEEGNEVEILPIYPDQEHLPELLPIDPEKVVVEDKVFTVEDVYENATVNYVLNGEEQFFDGTKTIDKTMELESIKGLTKGTIIVKARLNPEHITEKGVYSIIGFGSGTAPQIKNTKAQLVGAYYDGNELMPRYEFSNGLYSSYSKNINYADGKWHVMAISFDDSYIFASGDGETVLNGPNGHYADEKFKGFFTRNQDMNSIQIGGLSGTDTNSNGVAYKNWIGDIAQITITDQVLTVEQANELTLAGENDYIQVTLTEKSFEPYKIGAEVGEFMLTGPGADMKSVVLKEGIADNAYFTIEENVLKTKDALPPQTKYTIVVTCDDEIFTFEIHSEVDLNTPIIQEKTLLRFDQGMIDSEDKDYDETVIDKVKLLDSMTLKMQFSQGKSGIGSMFSFSESKQANTHFHVYANGSTIGYELRGAGVNYSESANALRFNGANTLAFKADASDYTYKVFVNGELVVQKQMSPEEYKMASDFAQIDTVSLGRTARSSGSNQYPFTGIIGEVTLVPTALSDEELIDYTSQTKEISEEKVSDQPFVAGDEFGSNYFRIPALTELTNGDIMAAIDIRFGSTADSPNNLDTGVRFKRNGSWEEAKLVNYFGEYTNVSGHASNSASFIDPAVVEDPKTGIIYMLADAWPSGGGLFGSYSNLYGNGMVKINAVGEKVDDNEEGTYYVGLVPNGTSIVSGMEMTHYIKPVVSTNPNIKYELIEIANNQKTDYTLNAYFELFKDGVPLEVDQKRSNNSLSGEKVPMSIFYDTADFILYPVAYLWLSSSNDNGITWNDPQLIANEFKAKEMRYFIAGPGRGHVIQNGVHAGRILFPMYSDLYGERSSVIYSDDKGATWQHSDITTMTTEQGKNPGKSSEAQLVELPDGTIRMFARSAPYTNYVGYADSLDGGATFEPMRIDEGFQYASNVQLSVINYSKEIDGKPAIILSAPEGEKGSNQRTKGRIHVGLVHENPDATGYDKYDIEWKYTYEVNNTAYGYSCLAELPNGDIAVLYETDGAKPYYEEIPMDRILDKVDKPMDAVIDINEQCVGGTSVDIALTTKARVLGSLSDVTNSTLKVSFEGIDAPDTLATYKSINDEGNKLLYTVTLPESDVPYRMNVLLDDATVLVTINETMDAGAVKPLSTEVYTTQIDTRHTITVDNINGGKVLASQDTGVYGEEVVLSVIPTEGFKYKKDSLKVNGVQVIGSAFRMPNEDVTITVEFIQDNYSVEELDAINGTFKTSKIIAKEGDVITVSARPDRGYILKEIKVNGSKIDGTAFKMPARDVSVEVLFKEQEVVTYEVYIIQPINGSISVHQTEAIVGQSILVNVEPEDGYKLVSLYINNKEIEGKTFKMPEKDVTISAQFIISNEVTAPSIHVSGKETDQVRTVELRTKTPDATIYYTLDGSEPTQESLIYTEAIVLNKTATIKAIAVKEGMENSGVVTEKIVVAEDIKYSITFDSKDGSGVAVQEVLEGQKAIKPADPIRKGHQFLGWYIDESYTAAYNFDKEVTAHVTVYAKWKKNESGGTESTDNTPNSSVQVEVAEIIEDKEYIIVRPQVKADKAEWQTSKKQLQLLIKDKTKLAIETHIGKVILNKEEISNLLEQVGEEVVTFTIQQVERNKVAVGISRGREKKTLDGIGNIHITIPYTLTKNQSPNNVVMYYHDSIGSSKLLKTSNYQDNGIQAQAEGLGSYEVVYRELGLKDIENHWAKESIHFVAARDIMGGTATDKFSPEMTMTRGMFVTVLGRLANADKLDKNTLFTDVEEDMYYAPYIVWANEVDIAQGIGEGLFGPDEQITREQLACMLVKYMQLSGIEVKIGQNYLETFEDTDHISSWAKESMAILVEKGILDGSDGKLNPKQGAKRAEVAKMIHNIIK